MILNRWMSFFAGIFFFYAESAKCDTLVNFHVAANYGGLANNNTCPVIDTKVVANHRTRMYIDAGLAVGVFRNDPGYEINAIAKHAVCNSVGRDCVKTGIGTNDLSPALCGRVALEDGVNILHEQVVYQRQFTENVFLN